MDSGRFLNPNQGLPVAPTEEVEHMARRDTNPEERKVKTLAIRLDPELHAQLSVIAQLAGSTITEEIRDAIAAHVAAKAADGDLATAASELLDEIERDAAARRDALTGLLNQTPSASTDKPARSRGRKGSTGGTSTS